MQKAMKLGMAMAARIPMTAITIINPVSVKPVLSIFLIFPASKASSDHTQSTFSVADFAFQCAKVFGFYCGLVLYHHRPRKIWVE
nr:hypothetical protein [uncultured Desulfosarcina sp.]